MKIGEAARRSGYTSDTLRYYEKIGLLPRIGRDSGGRRDYDQTDLDRLSFIRRAQNVNFSLEEIRALLGFRSNPRPAQKEVLELTQTKLAEIDRKLRDLAHLKTELALLTNSCRASSGETCPILETLGATPDQAPVPLRGV